MTDKQYKKLISEQRGWGEDLDHVSPEEAARDFARVVLEEAGEDEVKAYLEKKGVKDWFGRFVDDVYSVA